jgi:antitoxin HicB
VNKAAQQIAERPYTRMVERGEDGIFTAWLLEVPGVISEGESYAEALENLDDALIDVFTVMVEQGQEIPAPVSPDHYSGRLQLRLTPSLHARAVMYAQREGVSLNRVLNDAVASYVGLRKRDVTGMITAGAVPSDGAFGLFVFGGGTFDQLLRATGCDYRTMALWVTVGGRYIAYIPGTRTQCVNAPFYAAFPEGIIPKDTPFVGRCAATIPPPAYAENIPVPPATFYGRGLAPGDLVTATAGGRKFQSTVDALGEWAVTVPKDVVPPGTVVTFALNGSAARETIEWFPGTTPTDIEHGMTLTLAS